MKHNVGWWELFPNALMPWHCLASSATILLRYKKIKVRVVGVCVVKSTICFFYKRNVLSMEYSTRWFNFMLCLCKGSFTSEITFFLSLVIVCISCYDLDMKTIPNHVQGKYKNRHLCFLVFGWWKSAVLHLTYSVHLQSATSLSKWTVYLPLVNHFVQGLTYT